uniref:Uncharacterized protein n=1 Tax=Desertifilum tharense IPPAS B-1220 TaxID=1781255 RepID=A0A1E5QGX3_9CYAN|nr:hypothetical protein BH720_17735 [Desertifilum tharense IPPAS B-1220]
MWPPQSLSLMLASKVFSRSQINYLFTAIAWVDFNGRRGRDRLSSYFAKNGGRDQGRSQTIYLI